MKKVAIAVIAYKNELNEYEKISLDSLLNTFGKNKDIFMVIPRSLNSDTYESRAITAIRFDDIWFSSYRKYSEFCLQPELYRQFKDYEYILIYQLDGFAFYDNLEYFCSLGYDYIGAPWEYGNFWYKNQNETIWYVGCGGVSLRKVSSFIEFTDNEDIKKRAVCEQEDMVIVTSYNKIKIAPLDIACEFCITEYFDPIGDRNPMFLHWIDHMKEESYRKAIRDANYQLPDYIPHNIEWNKEKAKRKTEYWKNLFCLEDARKAIEKLSEQAPNIYYIWGTGSNGFFITKMMSELGLHIEGYIDNDESRRQEQFMDRNVFSFDDVQGKDIFIIVSPEKSESIEKQLLEKNYIRYKDFILYEDLALEMGIPM